MSDKIKASIPDELWANHCPANGWMGPDESLFSVTCWPDKVTAESEQGTSETTHLVGVSPARFEAEVAARKAAEKARSDADHAASAIDLTLRRVMANAERLMRERDAAREEIGRMADRNNARDKRIDELEAELAAHRAEAGRPIGVGDVVQVHYEQSSLKPVGIVLEIDEPDRSAFIQSGLVKRWDDIEFLTRIGRAVRMPEGSPVPPVEGSV